MFLFFYVYFKTRYFIQRFEKGFLGVNCWRLISTYALDRSLSQYRYPQKSYCQFLPKKKEELNRNIWNIFKE